MNLYHSSFSSISKQHSVLLILPSSWKPSLCYDSVLFLVFPLHIHNISFADLSSFVPPFNIKISQGSVTGYPSSHCADTIFLMYKCTLRTTKFIFLLWASPVSFKYMLNEHFLDYLLESSQKQLRPHVFETDFKIAPKSCLSPLF